MSSKVRKIKRAISFTGVWAANVLTVTTLTPHYLVSGDPVLLNSGSAPQELRAIATVTGANTFTVPASPYFSQFLIGIAAIDLFRVGITGRQIFTIPRSTAASAVVQSFVTGAAGAVYDLELSLDGIHFVKQATVTHALVTEDTQYQTVAPAWVYGAINITSIGAATKLEIVYAG